MKCCECGAEINHVLVNHFEHDGTDRLHKMDLEDLGDGCYSVLTDTSWTGYGLETEDCLADVYCPKCKKFPFKTKDMEQCKLVQLVFWN